SIIMFVTTLLSVYCLYFIALTGVRSRLSPLGSTLCIVTATTLLQIFMTGRPLRIELLFGIVVAVIALAKLDWLRTPHRATITVLSLLLTWVVALTLHGALAFNPLVNHTSVPPFMRELIAASYLLWSVAGLCYLATVLYSQAQAITLGLANLLLLVVIAEITRASPLSHPYASLTLVTLYLGGWLLPSVAARIVGNKSENSG
ncbi:MAG: hypothetical protein FD130_1564, partial [Halothiobacillaceae bacterium]